MSNIPHGLENCWVLGLLGNGTKVKTDGLCTLEDSVDFGKNKFRHGLWRIDTNRFARGNEFDLLTSNQSVS